LSTRLLTLLALVVASCANDGSDAPGGSADDGDGSGATSTVLDPDEPAPGVVVSMLAAGGASGADGSFRIGDVISIEFELTKHDGSPWNLAEMARGRVMFAGPTLEYHRVLPQVGDVVARATQSPDGSWRYAFAHPIPPVYADPYNAPLVVGEGTSAGQPLERGTYTIGISFVWEYTVGGAPFVDVGEATLDVRFGGAASIESREVVTQEACDRCHVSLRAHGGKRRQVVQCLMCHTVGAEDKNDPTVAGGTPGVSIAAGVFFHSLHNGSHQPSVLGVRAVGEDGILMHDLVPVPLLVVGAGLVVRDFSEVGFPVWPDRTIPTPRDAGYSLLTPEAQAKEDRIRTGIVTCAPCHGDPDGAGPLAAPAQGDRIYTVQSRAICGSCHDDIDWNVSYKTMVQQVDDTFCLNCHGLDAGKLSVEGGHRHPLLDPLLNPGLRLELSGITESGTHDGDGTIDAGEALEVTFTITDDMGADVDPATLDDIAVVVAGPSWNRQILLAGTIPPASLGGPQPFSTRLSDRRQLEFLGDSSAVGGESFATSGAPHLAVNGALTEVRVRTATAGGATALAMPADAFTNFVDVTDAAGFARGDSIVIEDGVTGLEEYLTIQLVEGTRLWFGSPGSPAWPSVAPGLRRDHAAGESVLEVALTLLAEGSDYALDATSGRITEIAEFGPGNAVLATYTTDFVLPRVYAPPFHDSPDVDETWGEWRGKQLVPGTYTIGLWARRDFVVTDAGETNDYSAVSEPATADFLVESASVLEPFAAIENSASCTECHRDFYFHGGRERGVEACLLCHGASGAEDLPRYVAANAPETVGTVVSFRTLLHQIHHGPRLDDPASVVVVGEGDAPYPDNFEANTYETVRFPVQPGATSDCAKCHGADNSAWRVPPALDHPLEQELPSRPWRIVCGACHDSPLALGHMASETSPSGVESCAVCHGEGDDLSVERVHRTR